MSDDGRNRNVKDTSTLDQLSAREREVLAVLCVRGNVDAVAAELVISVETVRTHLRNIRAKLGVNTSLQAIVMASNGSSE